MAESTLMDYIITDIEKTFSLHAKKIKKNIRQGKINVEESEIYFEELLQCIAVQHKDLDFLLGCYKLMLKDMYYYRQRFLKEGKYANNFLSDVEKRVYSNNTIMEYHMHGLLLAQFLWPDQYYRLQFFKSYLNKLEKTRKYLEIGAGHGLYVKEVLQKLPSIIQADIIDISETSLTLSKALVNNKTVNFHKKNIFETDSSELYDFISVAEVIEHVENPVALLEKIKVLLNKNGIVFLSTPVNSPMIDHIYLFNSIEEIRSLIDASGFRIIEDTYQSSEDFSYEESLQKKVPIMYAAFLESKI